MAEEESEQRSEMKHDVKRLIRDLMMLFIFVLVVLVMSFPLRGETVKILGRSYPLEGALLVLFLAIFLPLTSLLFYDLKKAFDDLSSLVVKNFPGMREEVPPMNTVMRSLVQIILIFLVSVVVVPLTAQFHVFGISVSALVSALFLLFIMVFVYVIIRNVFVVAEGYAGKTITRFVEQEKRLEKKTVDDVKEE